MLLQWDQNENEKQTKAVHCKWGTILAIESKGKCDKHRVIFFAISESEHLAVTKQRALMCWQGAKLHARHDHTVNKTNSNLRHHENPNYYSSNQIGAHFLYRKHYNLISDLNECLYNMLGLQSNHDLVCSSASRV